jgi:hypothetical protein
MVIKYINIFQSKALQNLPKIGIFGLKSSHLATLDLILNRDQARDNGAFFGKYIFCLDPVLGRPSTVTFCTAASRPTVFRGARVVLFGGIQESRARKKIGLLKRCQPEETNERQRREGRNKSTYIHAFHERSSNLSKINLWLEIYLCRLNATFINFGPKKRK